jgi:hypothetical protein
MRCSTASEPSSPRETCPTCGRDVALRRGGRLPEHRNEHGELCAACGYTIRQVEQKIADEVDALRRMSR